MSVRVSWRTHQVPVERKFLPLFVFATTTTMTTTTIRSCVFLICRQFRLTKFIVHFVDLRVDGYGPPFPALSFRPSTISVIIFTVISASGGGRMYVQVKSDYPNVQLPKGFSNLTIYGDLSIYFSSEPYELNHI